jgi:transcriptional regulator with XRE-family HTH domain
VIGKKITELRNKKGLTQKEAAKKLKMPRSTYSNYELDKREPDFDTAQKLAEFFDISIDELLGRGLKEKLINEETEADRLFIEEYRSWDEKKKAKYRKITELLDE